MKKLLYAVAALLVLVVAAAALAPAIIDEARIKARIATEVKAATGRDLAIDGHLEIALLPTPRLSLSGLRLSNLEGASAPYVVRLKALEASLALAPLLSGELAVTSLHLVEPLIELERLADGRVNWSLAGAAPRRNRGAAPAILGGMAVSVERLTVVNGTLTYRDSSSGRLERFEGIEARLSAGSLQGPFAAVPLLHRWSPLPNCTDSVRFVSHLRQRRRECAGLGSYSRDAGCSDHRSIPS